MHEDIYKFTRKIKGNRVGRAELTEGAELGIGDGELRVGCFLVEAVPVVELEVGEVWVDGGQRIAREGLLLMLGRAGFWLGNERVEA